MSAARSMKVWVAACAMFAAPVLAAAQAGAPVVAVLYFDNNSFGTNRAEYEGLGKGIADLLINDMASNPAMRVVERDRIQSIMQEQNLVATKAVDPQTAVRLGKLLGAQYLVTGGFMSDGKGTLIVTSRVINVETGAITNPMKLQTKGDDVLGLIAQLSTKLNSDLELPALPRRTGDAGAPNPASAKQPRLDASTRVAQASPKPQKLDVKTALLYSKALDEQDSGHSDKAAELYRAVLEKFPDFGPAKQNLAKVQKSGD